MATGRVLVGMQVVLVLLATTANANDSAAVFGAGGLVPVRNEFVRMLREDLDVSLDLIKVRYVFRNVGKDDVVVRIAFPMPTIDGRDFSNTPIMVPAPGTANFMDFHATVDSKPIEVRLEEKAVDEQGRDITDKLRRFGLSPNFMLPADEGQDDDGAVAAGLLEKDVDQSNWNLKATFHWEQVFPADKDVVVEHEYRPIWGTRDDERRPTCVDQSTRRGIARMWAGDVSGGEHYHSRQVAYVLTTARNWLGPIGLFHLTIRKDRPETLVSTCLRGLAKTGPVTFETTAADYVPEGDLDVLFVLPPDAKE